MTEAKIATISSWAETLETNQDEAIESADEMFDYLHPEHEKVVRSQATEVLDRLTGSPYKEEVTGEIAQFHEDQLVNILKHLLGQDGKFRGQDSNVATMAFRILKYNPTGEYQEFISNYADPILNKGLAGETDIWVRLAFLNKICQEQPEKYDSLITPLFHWTLMGYREGKTALKALNHLANEHPEEFVEAVDNSENKDEFLSKNEWADRYSLEKDFIDIYEMALAKLN